MQENDSGSSPQDLVENDQDGYCEPDLEIDECWANCNCEFEEPMTVRFDVFDRRTGITYHNVTALCYQGSIDNIQLDLHVTGSNSRPYWHGANESYATIDPCKYSAFCDAIEEALDYQLKTLLAVASREVEYTAEFPEFLTEFESSQDDDDEALSEDHQGDGPEQVS